MSDWIDSLTPEERNDWDRFVEHFRRDALEKITGSGAFISLLPTAEENFDVKFATELGCAIMLDKPIIAIASPGGVMPTKLREVADHVIEADVDTEEGREQIAKAIREIQEGL